MKKASWIAIIVSALFLFSNGIYAQQQQDSQGKQQNSKQQNQQTEQFMDKQVVNKQGDQLGKVESVITDKDSGEIKYLMLSRGGILGMGADRITIPHDKVSQEGDQLTADIDFSELKQLSQQQDQQGQMGQTDQQQGAQMLDQVLGQQVTGKDGNNIGEISNLVIGSEGQSFAIITGQEDKQIPVPLNAIQRNQEGTFQISATQQDIQQAPSFQGDQQFSDMASGDWQQEVRGYYGDDKKDKQGKDGKDKDKKDKDQKDKKNKDKQGKQ